MMSTSALRPFRNLVRPGKMMLRPAQRLRLRRRIKKRLCAPRPYQPPERRLKARPQMRRRDRKQPALPLDHHPAPLGHRRRDQCDAQFPVLFGQPATHSAPARVLPNPRPAISSQVRH